VQAEQNLLQKSRNSVLPVPCPNCGFHQDEMSRKLKEAASINRLQVAGAVIVLLSFIPLLFAISYLWVLTLILAIAGLAVLSYGYAVALRFDRMQAIPNPGSCLAKGTQFGVRNWPNCSLPMRTPNLQTEHTEATTRIKELPYSTDPRD